jgi:hypothetical protein
MQIADNELSGWTQAAGFDTFYTMPIDTLNRLIDGPEQTYKDYGCKEIAYQTLTGPDPKVFSSFAMDFVTVSKAAAMFNYKKLQVGPGKNISSFDDATAFATTVENGVTAYAHFNKFYLEMKLEGFADTVEVLAVAGQFLNAFKAKIK